MVLTGFCVGTVTCVLNMLILMFERLDRDESFPSGFSCMYSVHLNNVHTLLAAEFADA